MASRVWQVRVQDADGRIVFWTPGHPRCIFVLERGRLDSEVTAAAARINRGEEMPLKGWRIKRMDTYRESKYPRQYLQITKPNGAEFILKAASLKEVPNALVRDLRRMTDEPKKVAYTRTAHKDLLVMPPDLAEQVV